MRSASIISRALLPRLRGAPFEISMRDSCIVNVEPP
jgi:hypothetical protein